MSAMMYKVYVRNGAVGYDEYKVYSHYLQEGCLVLDMGLLPKSKGRNQMIIPITQFFNCHTEDIDE